MVALSRCLASVACLAAASGDASPGDATPSHLRGTSEFRSEAMEKVIPHGGFLKQLTCIHNTANHPLPASTVTYEVGAAKTDEKTHAKTLEDTHEATHSLAHHYGFAEILSVEASASYTYHSTKVTTTSHMTSSTVSESLTLAIPEVGPHKTWCAYRLESMSWQSSKNGKTSLLFKEIVITDQKLDVQAATLVLRGKKQNWDDPRGYLLWTEKWGSGDSGWFAFMQSGSSGNVRGWKGDPGPQGHLIFKRRDASTFLISTEKWPDWYLFMSGNSGANIRGWSGDPGPQGHFLIKPHPYKSCYLISVQKWPAWHLFMQDNHNGNVRGWEGDPGDQGCWHMAPAYTRL